MKRQIAAGVLLAGMMIAIIIFAITLMVTTANGGGESNISCVEPVNDGRMVYGPYVLEYWGTEDHPLLYQDGSEAPLGSKTILLVPAGGGSYDSFASETARYWFGGDAELKAKYIEITSGLPDTESKKNGVAVTTLAPGEPLGCPAP